MLPRSGSEGSGQHLTHLAQIPIWEFAASNEKDDRNRDKAVNEQAQHHGHEVHPQLPDHFGEGLNAENLGGDQEEHAQRRQPE